VRETGRNGFKASLIKELEARFPGCVIFNMDPNTTHQGIPDLLMLFNGRWAMLEVKGSYDAKRQPNQDYWVEFYDKLSFASFICPEIEEEVLDELQRSLSPRRRSRVSQR
jgi:hypothetical protein